MRKLNLRELLKRSDCRMFGKALRTNSPLVKKKIIIIIKKYITDTGRLTKVWFLTRTG